MTTNEDTALYEAEHIAFTDTPLDDQFDRRSLIHEANEIVRHPFIYHLTGDVQVEEASVRLVRADAYARGQVIKFAPASIRRFVAVHEVAHVVHRRSVTGGTAHGAEYRAIYADLTASVYGDHYGDLLRHAFALCDLPVASLRLPYRADPIIPIDALVAATRAVRWL